MWQRVRHAGLVWPSLFAAAALVLLVGLGVWQLERLAWKEALLARVATRAAGAPTSLVAADQQWRERGDVEYLHVTAVGRFHHDKERYLYAPRPSVLGWHVYTPLDLGAGRILWVNRGWVDDPHKRPEARAQGQVAGDTAVNGLLRQSTPPGPFSPRNDPEGNLWYWPDLAAMTRSAFAGREPETLPFRLEADLEPRPPGGLPQGGVTRLDLPNRHLQYALTWFAMALSLIAVYLVFARNRLRLDAAGGPAKG
jgi:surfeit locus 1 family protein